MDVDVRNQQGTRASAYEKLAITLPHDLAQEVRDEVRMGHAPSVSAYIAAAVEEKRERDRLQEVLAQMDAEYGPVTSEELAWADRVLLGD